ncbi:hypothetical protein Celal_3425 [Cellulophaga algicola DSM 14237]|uniref:Uncharacterized protein n=1 Tax=Cellulophaga algicola (strain DSM 14237 / IC166 / ACAM 630) TaxID=688270 RepID=E6X6X7_CELAD|nr:hypothetical protein [Cellulophaga algicola]ADV50690.1 hypothetical protein Celal_3425 [Cellulophaga algicola DSM 14237]
MKIYLKSLIAILILVLSSVEINAQYGNGRSGNGYGRQRNSIPQAQTPQEEPKALTAEQIVDNEMPNITESVGLNPFEEAIVRTILTKSVQKRIELQILKLAPDKTREAMEKIVKEQEEELKEGLPEDKYEAFEKLQKERFKSKKKKKKKRKNKD